MQALMKSPAKFPCCPFRCCHCSWELSRCTGKSLLSLAPWEVCSGSSKPDNYFLFISVGEKAQTNQQKCTPKSQSILMTPQECCVSPGSSWVNPSCGTHSVFSNSGNFCQPPSTDKAMYICSVYYAEDAD